MRRPARAVAAAVRGERGFTLLELMIVVIIVGIIAALAVPSMRLATYDRHAYEDAGAIMQLFRDARLRSMARGSAILVAVTANRATDRGTFNVYEAVAQDPTGPANTYQMPVPTCKTPTTWTPPTSPSLPRSVPSTMLFVEGVNLNGPPESEADIETDFYVYSAATRTAPAAPTRQPTAYICYTPIGRSYYTTSSSINFNGLPASTAVFEARVSRGVTSGLIGATVRSVIVEPNGMPRILTKVQ